MEKQIQKAVGVRFKPAGKVYDFDCGAFVLQRGDNVIVETEQGLGFGTVAVSSHNWEKPKSAKPLKKIFRVANTKDQQQLNNNAKAESKAYRFCLKTIKELKLKMNLFAVESTFDASKMTFFFTADGRVDFRQLVKILVKNLGLRIEMRQVGIRNQAKMCGGLGRCGRALCCATFIEKFEPVSIRMAKEQSLSLNPTKISGQCGRLMCCLTFENETYKKLKADFPKMGKVIATPKGKGRVTRLNILRRIVTVRLEDGNEAEFNAGDLNVKSKSGG